MLRYVIGRVIASVPVLIVVVFVSFLLVEIIPGDAAQVLAGDLATPEQVEEIRTELGMDRPLPERFVDYVGDAATGDLNESIYTGRPVVDVIADALPATLSLLLLSLFGFAIPVGAGVGVLAAIRPGSLFDSIARWVSAVGLAVPPFVTALALIIPLAVHRSLFPATGYAEFSDPVEWLRHLALPAIVLGIPSACEVLRQARGAMVEVMEQDFIRTARAVGLRGSTIICRRVMRNAASPVVTVLGLQVGRILSAAVVVEYVFAIPGIGTASVAAVINQDMPLVQGVILLSAVLVLVANLIVDVVNGYLNPRLRPAG